MKLLPKPQSHQPFVGYAFRRWKGLLSIKPDPAERTRLLAGDFVEIHFPEGSVDTYLCTINEEEESCSLSRIIQQEEEGGLVRHMVAPCDIRNLPLVFNAWPEVAAWRRNVRKMFALYRKGYKV